MKSDDIATEFRDFIAFETGIRDAGLIPDDKDLFAEGVLDSLMTVSLVTFCEDRFGCEIAADAFSDDSMRTIRGLAAFVSARRAPTEYQ